jgi:hypothetical protein
MHMGETGMCAGNEHLLAFVNAMAQASLIVMHRVVQRHGNSRVAGVKAATAAMAQPAARKARA